MEKEQQMSNNGDQDIQAMGSREDTRLDCKENPDNNSLQISKEVEEKFGLQENNDRQDDNGLQAPTKTRSSEIVANILIILRKAGNLITGRDYNRSNQILGGALFSFLSLTGLVIYLEVIFHFLIYRSVDSKIIYPILFAFPTGALMAFITGLFSVKVNKMILFLLSGAQCIVFLVQLVYFNLFKVFFSFQIMGMADDAISEFGADVITAIKGNIGGLIILLLPLALLGIVFNNRLNYQRRKIKEQGLLLGGSVIFYMIALVSLLLFGKQDYSPYDLYFNTKVQDLLGQQLGITTMTRIDVFQLLSPEDELVLADTMLTTQTTSDPTGIPTPLITPSPEPTVPVKPNATPTPTPLPTPTPIDTSPNVMNIDFQALSEQEKDKTIKTLHNYFASVVPTNKNEYTGMFQGYNLIMITAEGFSPYAVHEEKTPTLYRLVREGFVFNNFYTPLWQTSTSDGEYVAMTGLIPLGTRSMFHGRSNLWPFSLGHQFNQLGVASKAYHNHSYTYYQRNETHTNMGYLWKAKGNGLNLPSDCWPESDLEMIDATVEEYVAEEQFHVYYLTVSGHMNYTFSGNSMSAKNKQLVQDLPYSEDGKAYIACQIELDRALEALLSKLEAAGVADRTVIALSADHYPYGWEKYKLEELAGHDIDSNFEIYKNHFVLWNPGMKENIVIDEPCSSLDILPTLSNLFGLEYDSRLLMGQDILSDAEPLVVLSNRSFITDKVMYNSATGETTLLTEEPLPEGYIKNLNSLVQNKFTVSKSMLEVDYYRHVFPNK
ncbi:MAG: hypothetical protein K0R34_1503 [Herbinix sp.]|jgi:hypothetical protein|nr:hypothetical protein [Herbinix sp.]